MIGMLLITHGKMAAGIKESAEMIVGHIDKFSTLSLNPGEDIHELSDKILSKIEQLNLNKGVIIFVDLFGASPYNATMNCAPKCKEKGIEISLVTGVNLPMIISTACNREFMTLNDLTADALSAGMDNIKNAFLEFGSISQSESDDY